MTDNPHAIPPPPPFPTLRYMIEAHIRDALAVTGNNQRTAAKMLGISRWSLARHLKRLGSGPAKRGRKPAVAPTTQPTAAQAPSTDAPTTKQDEEVF